MAAKIFVLCLSAVMVQSIYGQCLGPYGPGFGGPIGPGIPAPGLAAVAAAEAVTYGPLAPGLPGPGPYAPAPFGPGLPGIAASSGGGFAITSSSPISPNGVRVQTDNMAIEGPLAVSGLLPFLGVVALEGPLPVAGQGAVAYGCGTGSIGILNELGAGVAPGYPNTYGPEVGSLKPGFGYNGNPNAYGACRPVY